jgi:hypothetical protein
LEECSFAFSVTIEDPVPALQPLHLHRVTSDNLSNSDTQQEVGNYDFIDDCLESAGNAAVVDPQESFRIDDINEPRSPMRVTQRHHPPVLVWNDLPRYAVRDTYAATLALHWRKEVKKTLVELGFTVTPTTEAWEFGHFSAGGVCWKSAPLHSPPPWKNISLSPLVD